MHSFAIPGAHHRNYLEEFSLLGALLIFSPPEGEPVSPGGAIGQSPGPMNQVDVNWKLGYPPSGSHTFRNQKQYRNGSLDVPIFKFYSQFFLKISQSPESEKNFRSMLAKQEPLPPPQGPNPTQPSWPSAFPKKNTFRHFIAKEGQFSFFFQESII